MPVYRLDKCKDAAEKDYIFGQTGNIPSFPKAQKFKARATTYKDIQIIGNSHYLVKTKDGTIQRIRSTYLKIYSYLTEPTETHAHM